MNDLKLCIKDKHALIDLAKFGTAARRHIHPDLLIGSHLPNRFREGDILDANATYDLIIKLICRLKNKGEKGDNGIGIASIELIEGSEDNGGNNTLRITLTDDTVQDFVVKNGNVEELKLVTYTKLEIDAMLQQIQQGDGYDHAVMIQEQYDNLVSYNPNTIYFIVEPLPEPEPEPLPEPEPTTNSEFPYTFPISLGGESGFPVTFPVELD